MLSPSLTSLLLAAGGLARTALAQNSTASSGNATSNPLLLSAAPPENIDLNINISSGGYLNNVYRSNLTAFQLLLTEPDAVSNAQPNRLVFAQPAGNSGALAYFFPLVAQNSTDASTGNSSAAANVTGADLSVTLEAGSLASAIGPYNQTGVQGTMLFSNSAVLGPTQIGSVRQARDYVEGNGLSHEIFNYTVTQLDSGVVWFSRPWINDTVVRLPDGSTELVRYGIEFRLQAQQGTSFNVTPGNNGTFTPPSVQIVVPQGQTGKVDFVIQTNETSLTPLNASQIFSSSGANSSTDSVAGFNATALQAAQDQVSFLFYQEKALAGGWRFLTNFGRDTLFTLHLLFGKLSPLAVESILGAAIERANISSGLLMHEETIGDYASFININNNQSYLGNTPYLDYKMKDTYALLLPQLADYFLLYNGSTPFPQNNDSVQAFLNRTSTLANGTSYRDLVNANVQYMLNSSAAFAADPSNYTLLQANQFVNYVDGPLQPVGDWRDSNEGLGYGTRAFDVNTALWPAALYAIADLAQAGILNASLADTARQYAQTWETESLKFFETQVAPDQANALLADYVVKANLTDSLLYGNGSLNGSSTTVQPASESGSDSGSGSGMMQPASESNMSSSLYVRQLNSTGAAAGNSSGVPQIFTANQTFYALSLRDNGTTVDVMHSDLGFGLNFKRNISADYMARVVNVLQPFPKGLLTNVGMFVANPAYDANRTNIDVLDRAAYHGTVSWSWQNGLMALGLTRVLRACGGEANSTLLARGLAAPDWCGNATLVQQVQDAQTRLVQAINGALPVIFEEVWSSTLLPNGTFEVTPLGALSGGTESDAIQLWSYGGPLSGLATSVNDTVQNSGGQ